MRINVEAHIVFIFKFRHSLHQGMFGSVLHRASVVHIPVRTADFNAVVHSYEIQGSPGFIVDRCKDNKKSCKRIKTECV